jgi:tRNA (adenine57-N1/adenine58-N1)-methyltransferase catalytic subunit
MKKMKNNEFQLGDEIYIFYNERNSWVAKIEDLELFTNLGKIYLKDLVGKKYGQKVSTSKNIQFTVLPATTTDWIDSLSHKSQIIYQKDMGPIITMLNVQPGKKIIEAGTGSGALTSVLARMVGDTGRIFTHDIRDEAIEIAKSNIKKMNVKNVEFNLKDVREGFIDKVVDSIFLDMVDPWEVIPQTVNNLIPGGKLVIFQPTFNQLEKCVESMKTHGYINIRTLEILEREIEVRPQAVRPNTRMIGHSGFLLEGRFIGK